MAARSDRHQPAPSTTLASSAKAGASPDATLDGRDGLSRHRVGATLAVALKWCGKGPTIQMVHPTSERWKYDTEILHLWDKLTAHMKRTTWQSEAEFDTRVEHIWDELTAHMKRIDRDDVPDVHTTSTAKLQQVSGPSEKDEEDRDTAILHLWNELTAHMESTVQQNGALDGEVKELWKELTVRMESVTPQPRQPSPITSSNAELYPDAFRSVTSVPTNQQWQVTPDWSTERKEVATHSKGNTSVIAVSTQEAPRSKRTVFSILRSLIYRCWLLCATGLLTFLLLRLQSILDHVSVQTSPWRVGVQWAELSWLAPVPLAIVLWLGWFLFAEVVRPEPGPIPVPWIAGRQGPLKAQPAHPVRLVFRFVTRGENAAVLQDSVLAVHQAFRSYPKAYGPYAIEIVSDRPLSLGLETNGRTSVYVVPSNYMSPKQSRFKARALTYLQKQDRARREDWYIYLDEESIVSDKLIAGIYRFISECVQAETAARSTGGKEKTRGFIGQGTILYQGGNWFFRGADALRTADDVGRFRLQYALGIPLFGVHGSFIVVRGIDDAHLSFDVGAANSITEDAAWALRAWAQGYRFKWVAGYLHEQPPQHMMDFVKQRGRWLAGLRLVLRDTAVPLRYRILLGLFTGLWQLGFLPFLIALVALFVHTSPFLWMRLPADFAWATFLLAYLQGIDIQARRGHPFFQKGRLETQWKRAASWLLALCSIWYALLEAAGVIYSLRSRQGFFVIKKPSLAAQTRPKAQASGAPTLQAYGRGPARPRPEVRRKEKRG